MKKLTPLLATAAIASGLLLSSVSFAAGSAGNQEKIVNTTSQQTALKLLFVIKAPQGRLIPLDGKNYQLTIPAKDIKTVLAFSDRPTRVVKHLTPEDYVKMVNSGENTFKQDPPNAAVTIGENPAAVFEILEAKKDGNTIAYNLQLLNNQENLQAEKGSVSLYVDFSGGGTFPIP